MANDRPLLFEPSPLLVAAAADAVIRILSSHPRTLHLVADLCRARADRQLPDWFGVTPDPGPIGVHLAALHGVPDAGSARHRYARWKGLVVVESTDRSVTSGAWKQGNRETQSGASVSTCVIDHHSYSRAAKAIKCDWVPICVEPYWQQTPMLPQKGQGPAVFSHCSMHGWSMPPGVEEW